MYCNNCGKTVDNGAVFCTNCGKKLEAQPPVTMAEQAAAEEIAKAEEAVTEAASVSEAQQAAEPESSYNSGVYEKNETVPPFAPAAEEKTYFGKGALAFCLVIIGLLAISTGIFAGLYFSVI